MAEPEQEEDFHITSDDETQVGNANYTLGTSDRWPGWPGENVFRILIPGNLFGSLIGRRGQHIKKLSEDSKSRIKILEAPPSSPERVVMISSKERPEMAIPPAMDGLLRVHKFIINELNPEASTEESTSNNNNNVATRLLAPGTQFVSLIGKKGSLIRSIQETSRTTIRILRDLPPIALPEDSIIEMWGPAEGVHMALELVASHLRKFLVDWTVIPLFEMSPHIEHNMWAPSKLPANHYNPPWNPQSPLEMPVHHHMRAPQSPLGPPAHRCPPHHPLQLPDQHPDNLWAPPQLPAEHQNPPLDAKSPLRLALDHHNMWDPESPLLLPAHLRSPPWARRSPSPLPGQHPSPPPPPLHHDHLGPGASNEVRKYTQVPLIYADAVIGESGKRISYIRRASGAHIAVNETSGDKMSVEVSGTFIQVQIAQQLIQNFLAEAADAPVQSRLKDKLDRNYEPTLYGGSYRY